MVTCKKCGYVGEYNGQPCPLCKTVHTLTKAELDNELADLRAAIKNKEFSKAADGYRMLAELGYTEAETEYAKILEKGQLVPRNYDLAMEFFYRAAKKNDAYSAYRYSRLIGRANDELSFFWLVYSAVLGCVEAHSAAAEEFAKIGHFEDACYFYSLAAADGDTESIVKLARMYYDGNGVQKNAEYAKWYMDKLKIPPIYAIKLAYNLRGVTAKEPAAAPPKNYSGLLFSLKKQARAHGFDSAYLKICELLAERGDSDSLTEVGLALIQGNGCEPDFAGGIKMLTRASALNNILAHTSLAELYANGKHLEKDVEKAIRHYETAGRLGSCSAYEAIGDLYANGADVENDFIKAMNYYDMALKLGSLSALKKHDEIKQKRIELFRNGVAIEDVLPEDAFAFYVKAASMGHVGAVRRIAVCCEQGIGTKKDTQKAFKFYQKAVLMGDDDALLPLGICYANGIGTRLSYKKAKETLIKAERLGIIGVREVIHGIMERKKKKFGKKYYSTAMRLIYMKKFDAAKNHLDVAAELMNPRAIYTLGCLYEFGMGAPCDKEKAYSLYEQSYSMLFRDPRARYKLSVLRMLKAK